MNLREFAALKVGDKISHYAAEFPGEVVETTERGVRVCWHPGSPPFFYGANTTAWMHWDKVEATTEQL